MFIMINLSNYHSNGLPTAVWSNKVNLIGEKVYKPKLHFCEHCNKPILIYGRLIPCKHVFCFTCATLCLTQTNRSSSTALSSPQQQTNSGHNNSNQIGSPHEPPLPPPTHHHYHHSPKLHNNNNINHSNNNKNYNDHYNQHHQVHRRRTPTRSSNHSGNISKNLDLHRSDSNQSFSSRDNINDRYQIQQQQQQSSVVNIDESTINTTPTTIQQDMSIESPSLNGADGTPPTNKNKGCHRCGGKALRVERNTLNSIFVCQIETCRRTYLSARDLQAHVNHRHARNKSNHPTKTSSASLQAISSSPYISSSTLMHLNNQHTSSSSARNQDHNHPEPHHNSRRHSSNNNNNHNNIGKQNHQGNHHPYSNRHERNPRDNTKDRFRDRDSYQRDRERERDSKEYHRQSLQRAAQWAEQSAQMMEKGLTR